MGLFDTVRSLASTYAEAKKSKWQRSLQERKTNVDSGGTVGQYSFQGQDIDHDKLRDVKQMRESGGLVAALVRTKALMYFGTGIELSVPDEQAETTLVDGDELNQAEWLERTFDDLETHILDIGEDAIWYPYGAAELTETRGGGFGGIVGVEPWTLMPQTDATGEIVAWEQETRFNGQRKTKTFDADEIKHFVINKRSARDEIGISQVLRSEEEITQYKENQRAMQNAIEMHGFPEWHVKAGREGGAPLDDTELRRIIQLFEDRRSQGDTVTATGPDVELDRLDPGEIALEEVTSNDLQQLAISLMVPLEAVDFGSEGLGSGQQSKLRETILKLDILATQRAYTNQWVTKILKPVLKRYSPFDGTCELNLRLQDPMTGQEEMADLISKVGSYMTTNEARQKLDLPEKEDLEGQYGKPDEASGDEGGGLFGGDGRQMADIPDKFTENTGLSEDDFVPNSDVEGVVSDVLEFIDEEGLPNPENQREGAARANQLYDHAQNDEPLAPKYWEEISNFHARHRAQDNHECDESNLPEEADESDFDSCYWDPGYFSDKTWGGDAGKEQADRIVDAIAETENAELSGGDTDFSHYEPWEQTLQEMHQRLWDAETDTRLLNIPSFSQTPEFVKERIQNQIMQGAIFSQFDSLPSSELMTLREFMSDELTQDGWTIEDLTDKLMDLEGIDSRSKAQNIARTETASILNNAREEAYEEQGLAEDSLFYWSGDIDNRTTDACKWLVKTTNPYYDGDPVKLDRLKELIAEAPEHDDEMQDDLARPEDFVVHPNERKTVVRAPPDAV